MKKRYILAIDQGTSSSRAALLDDKLQIFALKQKESVSYHPRTGWVEQSAEEIWQNQLEVCRQVLAENQVTAEQIAAIGISNQRETTVVWDRSGKPFYPAIIWQDARTRKMCENIRQSEISRYIPDATGLVINPYFSATKLTWILDNVKNARHLAENGDLCFGTIDSWLIYNLSGKKLHITDCSNASRTMLFNINDLCWDKEILKQLNIPASLLPEIVPSSKVYGYLDPDLLGAEIPLAGIAGDQQAALYGQMCWLPGMAKNTYGTGCFMLMNTGFDKVISKSGLLSTIAWQIDGKVTYALEGSVFMAGAVLKWLRDDLNLISSAAESEKIAQSLPDNEGVYFVPAFAGLAAPYWDTEAKGIICGLKTGCGKAHIVRAALEAMAFQSRDVILCMEKDSSLSLKELHVDGGAAENNFLLQFQADILGNSVIRPAQVETTVLGAGMLAAKAVDFEFNSSQIQNSIFLPEINSDKRFSLCEEWKNAINKART